MSALFEKIKILRKKQYCKIKQTLFFSGGFSLGGSTAAAAAPSTGTRHI